MYYYWWEIWENAEKEAMTEIKKVHSFNPISIQLIVRKRLDRLLTKGRRCRGDVLSA